MGQKQAAYDATGAIVAFYDSIDSPAPQGVSVIDISDSEWQGCINSQGAFVVKNGALAAAPAPTAAELLAAAQTAKVAELSAACKAEIYAGFTSDALGSAYSYPAKDTDQQNLSGSVLASLLPSAAGSNWATPFWCADASGAWDFRAHTASQIQQVGQDGKAAILAAMARNQSLAAKVLAATTVGAVSAITWN
jgi:predicted NAD/FAD-dependent oxidoreductase